MFLFVFVLVWFVLCVSVCCALVFFIIYSRRIDYMEILTLLTVAANLTFCLISECQSLEN